MSEDLTIAQSPARAGGPLFSEAQELRARTGHDRLPPGQRLVREWPVLTYGGTPLVETGDWTLQIWGAVAQERVFDWEQFGVADDVGRHRESMHQCTGFLPR